MPHIASMKFLLLIFLLLDPMAKKSAIKILRKQYAVYHIIIGKSQNERKKFLKKFLFKEIAAIEKGDKNTFPVL